MAQHQHSPKPDWTSPVKTSKKSPETGSFGTLPVQRQPASDLDAEQSAQRTPPRPNLLDRLATRRPSPTQAAAPTLQAKSIATLDDPYDRAMAQEAKAVGNTIQAPPTPAVPSLIAASMPIQRAAIGAKGGDVNGDVEQQIQQKRGQGQALSDSIRMPMEQAFGNDFSGVRIHTNTESDQLNQAVQAKAFTTGQDIFFSGGTYQPESQGGQELLAHELTHVVQQTGGKIRRKSNKLQLKAQPPQTESEEDPQIAALQSDPAESQSADGNPNDAPQDTPQSSPAQSGPQQPASSGAPANADGGGSASPGPISKEDEQPQSQSSSPITSGSQPQGQSLAEQDQEQQQTTTSPEPQQTNAEGVASNPAGAPQSETLNEPELEPDQKNAAELDEMTGADAEGADGDSAAAETPPADGADGTAPNDGEGGTAGEANGGGDASGEAAPAGSAPPGGTPPTAPSPNDDGSGAPAPPGSGATAGGSSTPQSAEADPDFKAAITRTQSAATTGKRHAPAAAKSQEAQAAAVSPTSEVTSQAQANQIDEMEQAETPGFNKAAFKAKLMERIQATTPKTLSEADTFKSNNKIGAVKAELSGQVDAEKTASQAPLEEKTKASPDTSGIEPKPVTPLPAADVGTATESVGAEKAIPKPKQPAEVEAPLQQQTQQLDQHMADAGVTEEQLANTNEPEFKSALDAKQTAKTSAATAPVAYRQQEQGELDQAKAEAGQAAQQKLQGMQGDRAALLEQVSTQQTGAKGKDEQARAKVAGEIQAIYAQSKGKVEEILGGIDAKVTTIFDRGAAEAQQAFETHVDEQMRTYKEERYDGLTGAALWLKDKLLGMPDDVNRFYIAGRNTYIQEMHGVIDQVVDIIATELSLAKAEVANGRQQVQEYVGQLPEDLKSVGEEALADIQTKFDSLEESVDAKQDELIDTLANKYNQKLQAVDARIETMKAAHGGLVDKAAGAIKGVVATINRLKNMLMSVLKGAASAIEGIIKDPIGFLGNLISGIKQGFDNFVGNIWEHLQGGLIGWLTGAMGSMGIQIPDDIFSLPGIFDLVMQILGMSWGYVRGKAVKMMGEPVVAAAEKSYEVFQLFQEKGAMGLWEHVQEQFSDLQETVMGEIKNMIIVQVIQAGVKWVLGLLNPASAFVKACMLIYDIIMFFVNQGSQIISLVKAVIDGVQAIASGSVGAVAGAIENALVKSLPVVIGFMASLLGIGGLAGKVQKIVKKIRKRIDKAVDKLLLKAKKLFKGKKGKKDNKHPEQEDKRTANQKQKDLDLAIGKAEKLVKDPKGGAESIRNKLSKIKKDHRLIELGIKQKKPHVLQVYGKVNPEENKDVPRPDIEQRSLEIGKAIQEIYSTIKSKPESTQEKFKELEQEYHQANSLLSQGGFQYLVGSERILELEGKIKLLSSDSTSETLKTDEEPEFIKQNRVPLDRETFLSGGYNRTAHKIKGARIYTDTNGCYYHRDTLHKGKDAEIEYYDAQASHLGTLDPVTGASKGPKVKGRTLDRYLS